MARKSIVRLNNIIMLGFGLLMGAVFPFYAGVFVTYKSPGHFVFFVVGCLVAGSCIGIISIIIVRITILKVVRLVKEELQGIAEGQGDLTQKLSVDSEDIVGAMVDNFNRFIDRLNTMIGNAKDMTHQLGSSGAELSEGMNKTSTNIGDINELISTIQGRAQKQENSSEETQRIFAFLKKSFDKVTGIVGELNNNIEHLSERMRIQSDTIEAISQNTHLIAKITGEATTEKSSERTLLELSRHFADRTAQAFRSNKEQFTRIHNLLSQIDDVAEGTNILSINASIEAARAGQAGEGFRVVAVEIRELAISTEALTTEIADALTTTGVVIDESAKEIEVIRNDFLDNLKKVMEGINHLEESTSLIQKITNEVDNSFDAIKNRLNLLGSEMKSLDNSAEDTRKNITNLKALAQKIAEDMEHISDGATEISGIVKSTLQQSNDNTASIVALGEQVNEYVTA